MPKVIKRRSIELNIEVDKGSTFRNTVTWRVGDSEANAQPVDLTGATARLMVRASVNDATVLHEMNDVDGSIILGGATGEIELLITAPISTGFNFTNGVYGLEITASSGDVTRLLRGTFTAFDENVR